VMKVLYIGRYFFVGRYFLREDEVFCDCQKTLRLGRSNFHFVFISTQYYFLLIIFNAFFSEGGIPFATLYELRIVKCTFKSSKMI
jgi:hypothetical protein